ncbi:PIN domain-containing protein [Chitinophaga sp. OAE865]|uniref:PIN domain-containing protein n=1 Tax=Chitinophaga sp. OAE865 TaxID=2817898 RepID=UPI001AE9BA66
MTNTTGLIAVLDANVLYPAPIRDILLHLADAKLFQPKWTDLIHDEWIRNLLINRPDIKSDSLKKARTAMESAFPDAHVSSYESLIDEITLPDVDDRHVLAAAIKSRATIIVTNNVKDFKNAG